MALALEGLSFAYDGGDFALSVDALAIEPGECVALIGPSGSGKTTLLNLIAGVLQTDVGRISLNNVLLTELRSHQRRRHRLGEIGMIFQSFELLDYLDVRDNILLQARLEPGIAITAELEEQARGIAAELGLANKWRSPITTLSQGERQRVAVCRALLLDPQLVLADEPTGNLDPENKQAVLEQLLRLCRRNNRMLLTVTHDHSLLPSFDRVVDMTDLPGDGVNVA